MAEAKRKTPAGRNAGRRRDRVGRILDESLKIFAEQGYDRATYDDLIARSNISRGSFYWYFPSKEALYDAVLDYCVSGYVARLEARFEKTDPDMSVVLRLLRAVLADFDANRTQYRMLLRPPPSKDAVARMVRWNEDTARFMRSKVEPAVSRGQLDKATAEIIPDVLSAFLDGICVRLVLEDETSVSRLAGNIETFLARILPQTR
jgi:AcrR family transcriptional regulator